MRSTWFEERRPDAELALRVAAIYRDLPLTRILGLIPDTVAAGELVIRQPVPAVARNGVDDPRMHRGAIFASLDSALGAVAQTICEPGVVPSTIDLRVDWLRAELPVDELLLHAKALGSIERTTCACAEIYSRSHDLLAIAVANFALGHWSGLDPLRPQPPGADDDPASFASFTELMGIYEDDGMLVVPQRSELVGAKSMPAFHGGSVAAALEIQCERLAATWVGNGVAARPLSSSLQFLRPAMATESLLVRGSVERTGRTTAIFNASAYQRSSGDRTIAQTKCVYVLRNDKSV